MAPGEAIDVYDALGAVTINNDKYPLSSEPSVSVGPFSLCLDAEVNVSKSDTEPWLWMAGATVVDETPRMARVAFGSAGRHTVGSAANPAREFVHVGIPPPPHEVLTVGASGSGSEPRVAGVGSVVNISVAIHADATGFYEWRFLGPLCSGTASGRSAGSIALPAVGSCSILLRVGSSSCGVLATTATVVATNVDASVSTTDAADPQILAAGQEWVVHVITKESSGIVVDSATDVVGLYDTAFPLAAGPVSSQVWLGSGQHSATFVSTTPGVYQLDLRVNLVAMTHNPYTVTVVPAATHGPSCVTNGGGLTNATVGSLSTFVIEAFDEYGNARGMGGDTIVATMVADSGAASVVCVDGRDGRYTCTYTPAQGGAYLLTVNIEGLPLPGSPWRVDVVEHCELGFMTATLEGPCTLCAPGTYSDSISARSCKACPLLTTTDSGASSIANCTCVPGYYEPGGRAGTVCIACPPGASCAGGLATPAPRAGFFATGPETFVRCFRPNACDDGGCAAGYRGYLCNTCASGWYSTDDGACRQCPKVAAGSFSGFVLAAVVVAAGLAVGMGFFISRAASPDNEASANRGGDSLAMHIRRFRTVVMPASLSMTVFAFQVVGALGSAKYQWSGRARTMLGVFNLANMGVSFGSQCVLRSFYAKYALSILLPSLVCVVTCGTLLALRALSGRVGLLAFFAPLRDKSPRALIDTLAFSLGPVAYLPLSKLALIIFDCTRMPNGSYVLDADPGSACFNGSWWSVFPLGAAMVIIFVIGMPAYFAGMMYASSTTLFEPETTARLGSLYRLYRKAYYWGEVANLIKRLVLVLVLLFVSEYQLTQIGLLLGVLVGNVVILARIQPYYNPLYNNIDLWLHAGIIAVLTVGGASFLQRSEARPASGGGEVRLFVALCVAVTGLVAAAIVGIFRDWKHIARARTDAFATTEVRHAHIIATMTTELKDFETDPELLRAAGEFLLVLDSTVKLKDKDGESEL
ncbi:uncharacterized protein AMSG_02378 [Thecamonas trahens ATCC 50062]|uniref:Uncharacterized protein n=1 Tax=Thecamonas trahens ATCC 50062 TaxID=461836 RepID=A0A0L0DW55_THETB|nr:hypothetical protein AMSG_02378 [Thecamonas trahens ATCC 50062]KNC56407.1 hypothetical protein AMSG_02378 [Thecamonas trahens ATCC 50062]|eukprot:XP_013760920.1 hypothetical protein AMSG_02378 [Thecamonas trahens ATCC 50062]